MKVHELNIFNLSHFLKIFMYIVHQPNFFIFEFFSHHVILHSVQGQAQIPIKIRFELKKYYFDIKNLCMIQYVIMEIRIRT